MDEDQPKSRPRRQPSTSRRKERWTEALRGQRFFIVILAPALALVIALMFLLKLTM